MPRHPPSLAPDTPLGKNGVEEISATDLRKDDIVVVRAGEVIPADGDVIEVREKSKQIAVVLDAAQSPERDVPEYLEVDHRAMKGKFLRAPKLSDVPYPVTMEPNLVVEFYAS